MMLYKHAADGFCLQCVLLLLRVRECPRPHRVCRRGGGRAMQAVTFREDFAADAIPSYTPLERHEEPAKNPVQKMLFIDALDFLLVIDDGASVRAAAAAM